MNYIGAHRLIRVLGQGLHGQLWLADGGADGPVAIKRYHAHVAPEAIDAEIEALSRCVSRHVISLLDVTQDDDSRPALIVNRADQRGVGALLEREAPLAPGEAVTVIAPIAEAVAQLHRRGVAHGSLSAGKILLDPSGAPVLVGFAAAQLLAPTGSGDDDAVVSPQQLLAATAVLHDLRELCGFARQVLARTAGDGARDIEQWLSGGVPEGRGSLDFASRLADTMFDFAEPVPVASSHSTGPARSHAEPAATAGAIRARGTAERPLPELSAPLDGDAPIWLTALGLPEWLAGAVASALGQIGAARARLSGLGGRLRGAVGSIRPRYRVLGALGMLLLVSSAVVLLGGEDGAGHGGAAVNARADGAASSAAADNSSAPVTNTAVAPEGAGSAGGTLEQALTELLIARESCFAQLSVLCLDDVDQASSTAWQSDADAMRLAQSGVKPEEGYVELGRHIVLIDEFGDTALLSVGGGEADTSPASVLIVRTEAGWLIRSVVTA